MRGQGAGVVVPPLLRARKVDNEGEKSHVCACSRSEQRWGGGGVLYRQISTHPYGHRKGMGRDGEAIRMEEGGILRIQILNLHR